MDHVYSVVIELRTLSKNGIKIVNVLAKTCKLLRAPDHGEVLDLDDLLA